MGRDPYRGRGIEQQLGNDAVIPWGFNRKKVSGVVIKKNHHVMKRGPVLLVARRGTAHKT